MPHNPLVSIIIPTYNRAHLIGETLDSVLAQTYTNWECIIVDDGSTDHTDEVVGAYVQKDARFKYYHRPDTHLPGGNGARNYGFLQSKGAYVNWFDDDDVMLEEFIEKKVQMPDNIDIHISTGYYWDKEKDLKKKVDLHIENSLFEDYVLWKLQILTPSVFFKRSFLEGKELFSDKILRGQETEFLSRIFFNLPGKCYKISNLSLFLYRQHKDTKTDRNKVYHSAFKGSQAYIHIENFKRSLIVGNTNLINYLYQVLIGLFFLSLEKKDFLSSNFIMNKFSPLLWKINKWIAIKFYGSGKLLILIKRSSNRLKKYFKNFHFK